MTPHAEAIKTLEALKRHSEHVVRLNKDHDKVFDDDVNALTLAIDAMKVVEWLNTSRPGDFEPGDYVLQKQASCWAVEHVSEIRRNLKTKTDSHIEAPTLSELAAKLRSMT